MMAGLSGVWIYLDDVSAESFSIKEHYKTLPYEQDRVEDDGCCSQVSYLGHYLDQDGVSADPDKTAGLGGRVALVPRRDRLLL